MSDQTIRKAGVRRVIFSTVTVWTAIFVAVACFACFEFESERNQRLAYIERQISELYGPLNSLDDEVSKVELVFSQKWINYDFIINEDGSWDKLHTPKAAFLKDWRLNEVKVMQPIYEKMRNIIVEKSGLTVGDIVPSSFLYFIAFVDERKLAINRWSNTGDSLKEVNVNDQDENTTYATMPIHFENCLFEDYKQLTSIRARMRANPFLILTPTPSTSEGCRQ